MKTDYDVIIIGSGAGGGTLAHRLAPSGKSILILERGGWLKREPENWDAEAVFKDNRYVSPDIWHHDNNGKPFQPGTYHYVGGATKMYGAALYRLRERDFTPVQHEDGLSPGWPLGYSDFEPYYLQAEQLYQVHGTRGEDPTEPPASGPYPFPAVSHEPRIQQLSDDLAKAGYHPFHSPCGIMLNEANMPYSRCVRCMDCDGFPCVVHAKSDAEVLAVRPALEHSNVTLLIHAKVVKLNTNAAGTAVTEVMVELDGKPETFRGQHRGRRLRCGAHGGAAAEFRQRQASPRPGQRLGPGGAQLHVPHQPGRAGDLQGTQPDQVPEDPRPERFLLRHGRLRLPGRQHPDGRQIAGPHVPGRKAHRDVPGPRVHSGKSWPITRWISG